MSAVPVGGTTGHCHESTTSIDEAAAWMATRPAARLPSPIVPELGKLFGLTPEEACVALREAALIRGRAN